MSYKSPKKAQNNLDFVIYETKEIKCDQNSDDPIEGCTAVKRLLVAQAYYSRLDVHEDKHGESTFIRFIKEHYPFYLEDYGHLMSKHNNNFEEINGALKENKLFTACGGLTKCSFTQRHHSRPRSKLSNTSMDADAQFYCHIMDSVHFNTMHLYESGLRMKTAEFDDNGSDKYLMHNNKQQYIRSSSLRTATNKKFNISTPTATKTVFTDELFRYLLLWKVKIYSIHAFAQFIQFQDFDSDSVKRDIEHGVKSNIAHSDITHDHEAFKVMVQFANASKVFSHSFHVGYRFFYWDYYKNTHNLSSPEQKVLHDAGLCVKQLLVKKRYSSFKAEISNYTFIDMQTYKQTMVKVTAYFDTDFVKQLSATRYGTMHLHYGILWKDPMQPRHLLALCLYTDFSSLSAHFSATFRKITEFEPIESVRARNTKYVWMSKCLRECVEIFGQSRWGDMRYDGDQMKGPFYTGLSVLLNVPSFHMRLCGPTSVSGAIAVAINFSGKDGCILEIDNRESSEYMHLHGFNSTGFSDFAEEDERLFFGGLWYIKVTGVRILSSLKTDYKDFVSVFYYLNLIVTGAEIAENTVTNKDVKLLKSLINYSVNKEKGKLMPAFDEYLQDTFTAVTFSKTYITLKFMELRRTDRRVRNLLMFPLHKKWQMKETKREANDKSNLFKPTLLKLFPNVKSIFIESTARMVSWSMSMVGLLAAIKSSVTVKQVIVQATNDDGSNWVKNLWDSNSTALEKQYHAHGYNISVENIAHDKYQFEIRAQNALDDEPETDEKKESDSFDDMFIEEEKYDEIQQTDGETQVVPTSGN